MKRTKEEIQENPYSYDSFPDGKVLPEPPYWQRVNIRIGRRHFMVNFAGKFHTSLNSPNIEYPSFFAIYRFTLLPFTLVNDAYVARWREKNKEKLQIKVTS